MVRAWRPLVLDASDDPGAVEARRRDAAFVHDTIEVQLRDLAAARSPQRELSEAELAAAVDDMLGGRPPGEHGRWVFYPWSGRLVHLLAPPEFDELRLDRNRHKLTRDEQRRLRGATIGIVGLSVGNAIALTLALEGVGGHLRLADFDRLDLSNMNRVRAAVHDIGVPKVVLAARQIAEIDPYLELSLLPDGLTFDNVDAFLRGGGELGPPLDVVVDECDGLAQKFLLRERARELRLPVVMETSDRGLLDVERFDLEPDRALLHGRMDGAGSADVAERLRAPKRIADGHKAALVVELLDAGLLSTRMAATMVEVDATVSSWPQLASDVVLGGASATVAVRRLVLGQPLPSGRRYVDLQQTVAGATLRAGDEHATAPPAPRPRLGAAHPDRADDVPPEIRAIVEQAVLAPSGANAQPWHFHWDAERLWVARDDARSRGVLDSRGHATLLALGAAIENAAIAAAADGRAAEIELLPAGAPPAAVAALRFLSGLGRGAPGELAALAPFVARRSTDRRIAERRPIDAAGLAALAAAARTRGADLQLRDEPAALEEIGRIVGASDRIRLLCPATHAELAGELRLTRADARRTMDGITLSSLELDAGAQAGVQLVLRPDVAGFLREIGGGRRLEEGAQRSLAGASAAVLLTLGADTPDAWLDGGRALQRVWLEATRRGLGMQPMTVLLFQLEMLDGPAATVFDDGETAELRALEQRLYSVFERPPGPAAMLLRVVRIDGSPERALRLPASWVLSAGEPPAP